VLLSKSLVKGNGIDPVWYFYGVQANLY